MFEAISVSAVNIFILISGYFLFKSNKRNLFKPLKLLLQVICFNLTFYLLRVALKMNVFCYKDFFKCFMPENYYVMFYIALYFISPYINIIINKLKKRQICFMILIFIILFSIFPTIVDCINLIFKYDFNGSSTISIKGSLHGYTIVNFILLYILGAAANILPVSKVKNENLLFCLFFSVILIFLFSISKISFLSSIVYSYCSPLVILVSVSLFLLFLNNNKINFKVINFLSASSFTFYIIHIHFLNYLMIDKYVSFNIFIMLLHIIFSFILIYFISFILYFIFNSIFDVIFKHKALKYNIFDEAKL